MGSQTDSSRDSSRGFGGQFRSDPIRSEPPDAVGGVKGNRPGRGGEIWERTPDRTGSSRERVDREGCDRKGKVPERPRGFGSKREDRGFRRGLGPTATKRRTLLVEGPRVRPPGLESGVRGSRIWVWAGAPRAEARKPGTRRPVPTAISRFESFRSESVCLATGHRAAVFEGAPCQDAQGLHRGEPDDDEKENSKNHAVATIPYRAAPCNWRGGSRSLIGLGSARVRG